MNLRGRTVVMFNAQTNLYSIQAYSVSSSDQDLEPPSRRARRTSATPSISDELDAMGSQASGDEAYSFLTELSWLNSGNAARRSSLARIERLLSIAIAAYERFN